MNGWIWVLLVVAALMLVVLAACGGALGKREPFVDATRDDQGNVVIRDTARTWQDLTQSFDRSIALEVASKPPPGGVRSWNDFWLARIRHNQADQENASRYVAYIIETRRKAGLPELQGLPVSSPTP